MRGRPGATWSLPCCSASPSILFITHERDGLDQVDHIVVLDDGRVAEQGSQRELRYAGGHYQRMWESRPTTRKR